jgi:hypothetical protein
MPILRTEIAKKSKSKERVRTPIYFQNIEELALSLVLIGAPAQGYSSSYPCKDQVLSSSNPFSNSGSKTSKPSTTVLGLDTRNLLESSPRTTPPSHLGDSDDQE